MTNHLDMATAESARSVPLLHLAKSSKRFRDFVSKWYPRLEVEVVSVVRACAHGFALAHDQVFYF